MRHNNWRKIAILSSTENVWIEASSGLSNQLESHGTEVLKPAAFEPNNFKDATLSLIQRSGIRIVLLLAFNTNTPENSRPADRALMTSAGWAWLLTEEKTAVTAMAGWLFFRPFLDSNMETFAKLVSKYSTPHFGVAGSADSVNIQDSVALHEAIMLYAHAVTKLLLEGGDLNNGTAVTEAVRSTTFEGVGGGTVVLDEKGDRIASYEVMNIMVDVEGRMSSVPVGLYNSTLQQYKAYERAVVWPGEAMEVPVDYFSGEP